MKILMRRWRVIFVVAVLTCVYVKLFTWRQKCSATALKNCKVNTGKKLKLIDKLIQFMKHQFGNKIYIPVKSITVFACILSIIAVSAFAFSNNNEVPVSKAKYEVLNKEKDSIASVQAFMQVYAVLMSPRCMNCHPSGDRPLQGDDNHIHIMNVQRG